MDLVLIPTLSEYLLVFSNRGALKCIINRCSGELGSRLLPFDHIHPLPSSRLKAPSHIAVLYASFESDTFRPLHETLFASSSKAGAPVQYVIRPIPPSKPSTTRNYLSGYGVALDLKKTDYLSLDDRRASSGVGEGKTGKTLNSGHKKFQQDLRFRL